MTRRNLIKSLIEEQLAAANSASASDAPTDPVSPAPQPQRTLAGPVRSMGLTLDKIEDEARALKEALAKGQNVIEIDPARVEPSFVLDRFNQAGDEAFEQLKTSLREHGQEVPVLVRPHPIRDGQFQLAYGHRRWRAAKELGLPLKAVVRAFNDEALVLAQGLENSARKDLSFIEKAMFAKSLEDRGTDRQLIMAALSTDKTELSKLISVARAVPEQIARAIGPAPKAGRRRWMDLAEHLNQDNALAVVQRVLADPDVSRDSDTRFLRVLAAVSKPATPIQPQPIWSNGEGRGLAFLTEDGGRTILRFDTAVPKDFAAFLGSRLASLFDEYEKQSK
jgi:ParB family transcriptional regulator, chromosome partitioning protein